MIAMSELNYKGFKCEYETDLANGRLLYAYYDNKGRVLKDVKSVPLEYIMSLTDNFECSIEEHLKNIDKAKQKDRDEAVKEIMSYVTSIYSIGDEGRNSKIIIDISLPIEKVHKLVSKLHI